jgi:hypothetical protein
VRGHLVAVLELATAGQGTLFLTDSNTPGVSLDPEQHEAPPITGAGLMTAPSYGTTTSANSRHQVCKLRRARFPFICYCRSPKYHVPLPNEQIRWLFTACPFGPEKRVPVGSGGEIGRDCDWLKCSTEEKE